VWENVQKIERSEGGGSVVVSTLLGFFRIFTPKSYSKRLFQNLTVGLRKKVIKKIHPLLKFPPLPYTVSPLDSI
jgi:hypothetical protein